MSNIRIGYNAANLFDYLTPSVSADIRELAANTKIVERHPGGAHTNKINPYRYRNGWGINMDCIDIVLPDDEAVDENGGGRAKWIRKMEDQPEGVSYMDELAQRCKDMPNLEVVWTANVQSCTAIDAFLAIDYMIRAGVRITWVEFDNEAYGKYYSFDDYITKAQLLADMLRMEYPAIKLSFCVAPTNTDRRAHKNWNDAARDYWNMDRADENIFPLFDAVSVHFYYGARELPEAYGLLPPPFTVDFTQEDERLRECFNNLATRMIMNNGAWGDEIDFFKESFDDVRILITEFNTQPGDAFGNTLVNCCWEFITYIKQDDAIELMTIQNGNGETLTSRWSTPKKQDAIVTNDQIRRLGYYTFKLLSMMDATHLAQIVASQMTIDGEGRLCLWYANLSKEPVPCILATIAGIQMVSEPVNSYVQGKYMYSSSGATGFQDGQTPPNYEIDGVISETYTGELPPMSYGFIEVVTKKTKIKVNTPRPRWWVRFRAWLGI